RAPGTGAGNGTAAAGGDHWEARASMCGAGRTRPGGAEPPVPAPRGASGDQPGRSVRPGRGHGDLGMPGPVQGRLGGLLVQQDRDAGRDYRQARCGREAPPEPDQPALPDGLVQRRLARRDGLERLVETVLQVVLVADAHESPPSTSSVLGRRAARAREAWLFTVPTEQPSTTAASVSVSPTQ